MRVPENDPITLPTVARQLPAALTPDVHVVGETALTAMTASAASKVQEALDAIRLHANLGAAATLEDLNPDLDELPELLAVRAWLLAVSAGAQRLGAACPPSPTPQPSGAAELRHRYQADLAAAERDGVLALIDDLLEL